MSKWIGKIVELGDSLDIVTGGDHCFRVPAGSMVEIKAVTPDGFDVEWEPLDDYGPIRFEILREDVVDGTDLIAAAFGLPASAEAQAEIHLLDMKLDDEATRWQQAQWDALTDDE